MIPENIRALQNSVVCIYTVSKGRDIQFSGFIIDTKGVIVCTAHDLNLDQHVSVTLNDGGETRGQVVQIDPQRDLSLIRVDQPLEHAVSLRNGRYLLQHGDTLFAVTCPMNHVSGIQAGFLDGPPRRVQGLPLWQVQMHIDHGSSGSPVFDAQGRLSAIVKGRFRGTDSVGFLIPFETLLNFLDKY
jgi:serine protease Do